jgi:hypothetical protein
VFHNPITRTLPGAVAEAFPSVTPAHLRRLGLAHVLCLALAFIDDRLNDDHVGFSRELNLLRRSMEAEVQARLSEVVGAHAGYWRAARQALRDYAVAHVREAAGWRDGGADDSHARYAREAAGKLAPARLSALAVAILGGASTSIQTRLARVVDQCAIALQYVDDVGDWEDDYRSGRPTYFVRRHLSAAELRQRQPRLPVAELRSRVRLSNASGEFLQRASHHFGRCEALLDGLPMPTLRTWAASQRDEWARRARVIHGDRQRFRQTLSATLQTHWPT